MAHRLKGNDIRRLQNQKRLFDAESDPRAYSVLEVQQMSNHLIDIWSPGAQDVLFLSGMDYLGTF